jgi:RNA polymerase I-specific transcription-initiation factor
VKNKVDVAFKQQIQQIVFPGNEPSEDLYGMILERHLTLDFFAVRTLSEVSILTCSRTDERRPSAHKCISLPLSSLGSVSSKYIAETAFNQSGTHIAIITGDGHWTVLELSLKKKDAVVVSSGSIVPRSVRKSQSRMGWWKFAWAIDVDSLVVAESEGLHLVNVKVRYCL